LETSKRDFPMKSIRLHLTALALLAAFAFGPPGATPAIAQASVNCAPSTPCNASTGPSNTATGDAAWVSFGKINANFALLPSQLFSGAALPVNKGGTGALTLTGPLKGNGASAFSIAASSDFIALWSGTCSTTTFLRGDGSCQTPAGGGNVSNSGTPTIHQTGVWQSATTIAGVGPGTTGQAFASTGASTDPAFTSSLSGVTSINGSTVPSSSTLAGLTIAETWSALQTFGNSDIALLGSSTGFTTFASANAGGTNFTLTFPATTDTVVTLAATQTLTNKSIAGSEINSGTVGTGFGGTGAASLASANIPVQSGAITSGHCVQWATSTSITDSGAACGAGGSSAFSAITSSTNATAAMVVGTGASLTTSGTGSINATQVNGAAVPTSAALAATNSSNQITAITLGSNFAISSGTLNASQPINAQTGTTYAMLTTDAGKLVTFSNAASVAVSLSVATTTGFTAGYSFDVQNKGVGTVTITPTTSTINGASTLAIVTNQGCTVTSDGTNYQVSACTAVGGGGGGSGTVASSTTGQIPVYTGATTVTGSANATLTAGAMTLGVSGTAGSVKMGNATSGTVQLQPVTGALGAVTASLPANTGTLAETNLTQTWSAVQTFGTNISIGGATVPISAGMVSTTSGGAIQAQAVVAATGATGPTNDYAPTGFNTTTAVLYITPAAGGSTYNGLVAQNSLQQVYIVNAEAAGGADNIFLVNQSSSDTTAANRFLTSATVSLAIPPGGRVLCVYLPSAVSRWQCQ
jgi:hypothetical protein